MRYFVISATGKAVDSRCDKEPQSTSDKEVKSDMDQTFPQNKPDSSKCQYCRALSSGLAPSLTRDRSIRRARTLCLPSVPCFVLKDHPGSSQLQTSGQYLDFSLAGGARTQWPCRPR